MMSSPVIAVSICSYDATEFADGTAVLGVMGYSRGQQRAWLERELADARQTPRSPSRL